MGKRGGPGHLGIETQRQWSDLAIRRFEAWLLNHEREPAGLAHYRDMHLIPADSLAFEAFPEFLTKRRALLRQRLIDILRPEQMEREPIQDELADELDREGGEAVLLS